VCGRLVFLVLTLASVVLVLALARVILVLFCSFLLEKARQDPHPESLLGPLKPNKVGIKPIENISTFIPESFANKKCPNS
jgi:hypothetical protein